MSCSNCLFRAHQSYSCILAAYLYKQFVVSGVNTMSSWGMQQQQFGPILETSNGPALYLTPDIATEFQQIILVLNGEEKENTLPKYQLCT